MWMVLAGVACALIASGCSSGTSSSSGVDNNGTSTSLPSWTKSLGAGVTVAPPRPEAAGNASPGGIAMTYIADINVAKLSALCPLMDPAAQKACQQTIGGASSTGIKFKNAALGYIVTDGNEALVGLTGTYCTPNGTPPCSTNTDPSALFSSGNTFATLFTQALAAQNPPSSSNAYSLFPCIKVNSDWYFDLPASDF